jgi:Sigma-70, region 4
VRPSRERAETHLRLVAEAELRRAGTHRPAAAAAALYGLPTYQRRAIALQYYAGLSDDETARTIGLSLAAVRAYTARGLAELRTVLGAGTGRVATVAQVLTAAGVLDQETADQILADFVLARDARPAGPGRAGCGCCSRSAAPTPGSTCSPPGRRLRFC